MSEMHECTADKDAEVVALRKFQERLREECADLRAKLEAAERELESWHKGAMAARMLKAEQERDRWKAHAEKLERTEIDAATCCAQMEKERDGWKWEYENLCKFATQFEQQRDDARAALASAVTGLETIAMGGRTHLPGGGMQVPFSLDSKQDMKNFARATLTALPDSARKVAAKGDK